MFKNLKDSIETYLKERNTQKKETTEVENVWVKTMPKKIKENAKILYVKNKTLMIKAKNPAWRLEIQTQKEEIKKKLTNIKNISVK